MGRGTKHKHEWKPTTLETAIHARRLYTHTAKIMANPKVFAPANDFAGATLWKLHDTTLDIYLKIWTANRINAARHPERAGHRLQLQAEALEQCRMLLALMELAKSQFHLDAGKFWHWANMAHLLGQRVNAWYKSDLKRYGATAPEEARPEGAEVAVG